MYLHMRDVSIVSSKGVDYEPVQTGTSPIEFVIKPLADYVDINKTELWLMVKITKQDESQGMARSTLWSTTPFIPSSNSLPSRSTKRW